MKKVVNVSTQQSTKSQTRSDGTVIDTITTVTTETFNDGSTQTKTGVQTITKPPGSVGPGVSSGAGFNAAEPSTNLSSFSKDKSGLGTPPPIKGKAAPLTSGVTPKAELDAPISPSHAMLKATNAKIGPASTSGLAPPSKDGSIDPHSLGLIKATVGAASTSRLSPSSKAALGPSPKVVVGKDLSASTPPTVESSPTSGYEFESPYHPSQLGARVAVTHRRHMYKKSRGIGGGMPPSASPSKSNAPRAQNTTNSKFVQEALNRHNYLRAKHHSPPLQINADLMKISQAWANNIARLGKMQHSTSGFGENVYWSTHDVDGNRPTDQWYSEIKDFNWRKMEGSSGTGHFTQVVWKGTREFGIAMAKGQNGVYVVANYNPPGNFVGRYSENVLPM